MDFKALLTQIGDGGTEIFNGFISFISEKIGLDPNLFQTKIISLIILSALLMLSFRIAEKGTKIILIILICVFIVSTALSIFM